MSNPQLLEDVNNLMNYTLASVVSAITAAILYLTIDRSIRKYYLVRNISTELNWPVEKNYAGEPVTCSITFTKRDDIPFNTIEYQDLVDHVVVYVEKILQPFTKISNVIIESGLGKSAVGLRATFTVKRCGNYRISLSYSCFCWEYAFPDSPFTKEFVSGEIVPENTQLVVSNQNAICLQAKLAHKIKIDARDYYGNACNPNDVDLRLFRFLIKDLDTETDSKQSVEYSFKFDESDKGGRCLYLHIRTVHPSVYKGSISYAGFPIKNGWNFYVISISHEEEIIVEDIIMGSFGNIKNQRQIEINKFSATLIAIASTEVQSSKKVHIKIVPKYVSITDDLVSWKESSYLITSKTHLNILHASCIEGKTEYAVKISDELQGSMIVLMPPQDARVLTVTFAHFQAENILRQHISFEEKTVAFKHLLRGSSIFWRHSKREIKLERRNLIDSFLKQVDKYDTNDWSAYFSVSWKGENVKALPIHEDYEWLNLLCEKLFTSNRNGLFYSLGSTKLIHPTPNEYRKFNLKEQHFQLAGKILGKFLYEICGPRKAHIPFRFTRSFLSQLVGLPVTYQHLVQDFPEKCHTIKEILKSPNEVDKIVELLGSNTSEITSTHNILEWFGVPAFGGSVSIFEVYTGNLTLQNKIRCLNSVAYHNLMEKHSKEIAAFLSGFNMLIAPELLFDFSEYDLELLLCGMTTYSVADLQAHHSISTCLVTKERQGQVLDWFWSAIMNMTEEDRSRLLQFVTGSSVIPLDGFESLSPQFTIGISDVFGQKPIAITSINEIRLADHSNFEQFENNLLCVIHGDWRQI